MARITPGEPGQKTPTGMSVRWLYKDEAYLVVCTLCQGSEAFNRTARTGSAVAAAKRKVRQHQARAHA